MNQHGRQHGKPKPASRQQTNREREFFRKHIDKNVEIQLAYDEEILSCKLLWEARFTLGVEVPQGEMLVYKHSIGTIVEQAQP